MNSAIAQSTKEQDVSLIVLVLSIGAGFFMSTFDITATFLLLDTIKEDFIIQQNQLLWVTLTYLMIILFFTVFSGDLGDYYGSKMIFQIGVGIFSLGCILCFFSNSIVFFIFSRVILAIGVSSILSNGTAILTHYTSKGNRGTVFGSIFSLLGISILIGGVLSYFLTTRFGWNSIFLINIPIGILCFFLVQILIPKFSEISFEKRKKRDWIVDIAFAFFLTTFTFSLSVAVESELNRGFIWAGILFLISLGGVAYFVFVRKTRLNPVVGRRIRKNKRISRGIITAAIAAFGAIALVNLIPFYLQEMLGVANIFQVYLIMSCIPIGIAFSVVISGRLSEFLNARILILIGFSGITVSFLILISTIQINSPIWILILVSSLMGVFTGTIFSPNQKSIMAASAKDKLGVVGALSMVAIVVGIMLSTAFSSIISLLTERILEKRTGLGIEHPPNYLVSMRVIFVIFLIFVIIGAIYSFTRGVENMDNNINSTSGEK